MRLLFVIACVAMSGCKPIYRAFDPGDVVHHKSDGSAAVVLTCEDSFCRVTTGSKRMLWYLVEIAERPKRQPVQ